MPTTHDPNETPVAAGGYTQALEVSTPGRLLHISGQIPEDRHGGVATDFDDQCRRVWANIRAILDSAGMGVGDLVKVTTYLADRTHADANSRIRRDELGPAKPALTVVIVDIYDERWLLEIDAVAFRETGPDSS